MRLRGRLYGLGMKKCGKDFQVTHDVIIRGLENLSVGNHVYIGNMTVLLGSGKIYIDDNVQIGPHCTLASGKHKYVNGSFSRYESEIGKIVIEKGSWIAANCVLAYGAVLPQGSVLAACSYLSKPLKNPNSIYGGVPAEFIMKYSL